MENSCFFLLDAEQNIQTQTDYVTKSDNRNPFELFLYLIKESNFCDLFEKEKLCNDIHQIMNIKGLP